MARVLGKVAAELASIGIGVIITDTGATVSTSIATADRVVVTAAYSGIGYLD